MVVVFFVLLSSFPSGLILYWLTVNVAQPEEQEWVHHQLRARAALSADVE